MSTDDYEDFATGRARRQTGADAFTGVVVRVEGGTFVAELDDDTDQPIGPCRGPLVDVGDVVLVVWTAQGPWIAQST